MPVPTQNGQYMTTPAQSGYMNSPAMAPFTTLLPNGQRIGAPGLDRTMRMTNVRFNGQPVQTPLQVVNTQSLIDMLNQPQAQPAPAPAPAQTPAPAPSAPRGGGGGGGARGGGSASMSASSSRGGGSMPAFEVSDLERQTRLSKALEGVRAMQGQFEDSYRGMATRAGLDPSSGVAQNVLQNMFQEASRAEQGVRESAFLDEESARRRREELLAELANRVQTSQIGANATLGAARIGVGPEYARVSLDRQMLPFQQALAMRSFMDPYAVNFGQFNYPQTSGNVSGGGNQYLNGALGALSGYRGGF